MEQYFVVQNGIKTQAAVDGGVYFEVKNSFRPFIFTVDSGADAKYTIPTFGTGYNYSVNTSDGQFFNAVMGNQLIIFPLANTLYDIEIRGLFPQIYVNNNAERLKVKDVKQCGDIVWRSFNRAFMGCSMNWSATDAPNLSLVTDMGEMFRFASIGSNIDFSTWDVSNVIIMQFMLFNTKYEYITEIDFSDPVTGSINVEDVRGFCGYTVGGEKCRIPKVKMQAGNIKVLPQQWLTYFNPFATNYITSLELIGLKVSWRINQTYGLIGLGIDDFFDSLEDITGMPSESITMRASESTSGIDTTIATNKGWTIIVI